MAIYEAAKCISFARLASLKSYLTALFLPNSKQWVSWLITCLISIALITFTFSKHKWTKNRVIIHDVTGYYSYLPAFFIYGDMSMNYRSELPDNEPSEGIWVNFKEDITYLKAPIGVSYFFLPSFWISHQFAKHSDVYQANGYSLPYQRGLAINTLIISILCLFICRRLLLFHFHDSASALAILLLVGGSNLYYYVAIEPAMAHPYGMFLVAAMLLVNHQFFLHFKTRDFLILAIVLGWMIAVRPTNAILAVYPLLYGLFSKHRPSLGRFLREHKLAIVGFALLFFIPLLPQMIYWKAMLGKYVAYSYDNESFFFAKSHVVDGFFSYRKGLFLYTPVMLLAFAGFLFMRTKIDLVKPLLVIIPVFSFVVFSWWCWWYGGYSSRVLIETYPLLLLGFAGFSERLIALRFWKRLLILPVILWCFWLNFRFVDLYERGVIHWDSMTKKNYQAVFWNNNLPDNYFDYFEKPNYEKALREGED